jgi:aspartyl-tRNA(Asn)/glutamyl-tRNA(Gln) amidotransferase subunit C
VTRSDLLQPFGDRETILQGAPERDDDFFRVPKIINAD